MTIRLTLLFGAAALTALSACGGGSSGGGATPPPQPALPSPAPTPAPTTTNFDTAEYRRSNAATSLNAIAAYEAGALGEGVTVAVVDSGINTASAQFTGRISTASADVSGGNTLQDNDGHGTSIAAVIAANADGDSIQGIAPRATIQALKAVDEGSCDDDGCVYPDRSIAAGVDAARQAGARVINLSLGGGAVQPSLRSAIDRATRAGLIVVISAGNDSSDQPDPLARVALDPEANDRIIIAGAIDDADQPADFNNAAGSAANVYLTALGVRVLSIDEADRQFLYSGTSYAAPGVTGALALLFSAFPNLTADEAIEILRDSARDLGAPGVDPIFGGGAVDIAAAFAPQGQTRIAGTGIALDDSSGPLATTGGAAGDGRQLGKALGKVIVLDRYGRAFTLGIADPVAARGALGKLAGPLLAEQRSGSAAFGPATLSLALSGGRATFAGSLEARGLDARGGHRGTPRSGFVTGTAPTGITTTFGYGHAPDTLLDIGGTMGAPALSWLSGTQRLGDDAIVSGTAAAVTQRLGAWTIGMAAGSGRSLAADRRGIEDRAARFVMQAGRTVGPVHLSFNWERLQEDSTFLGSRSSDILGLDGGRTDFAGMSAYANFGHGWALRAEVKGGLTTLDPGGSQGLATASERLRSSAMALELTRAALLRPGDRAGLRLSQPLRIEGGAMTLHLPTGYDYAAEAPIITRTRVALTPSGREIAVEAAYETHLPGGYVQANGFYRHEPGHIAGAAGDVGMAVRLGTRF